MNHLVTQSREPAWQVYGREEDGMALVLSCSCGWRQVLAPDIAANPVAVQAVIQAHVG